MVFTMRTILLIVASTCIVLAQNNTEPIQPISIDNSTNITTQVNGTNQTVPVDSNDVQTTLTPITNNSTNVTGVVDSTNTTSTTVIAANMTVATNGTNLTTTAIPMTTQKPSGASTIVSTAVLLFGAVIVCSL